jgi:hypothetical protein
MHLSNESLIVIFRRRYRRVACRQHRERWRLWPHWRPDSGRYRGLHRRSAAAATGYPPRHRHGCPRRQRHARRDRPAHYSQVDHWGWRRGFQEALVIAGSVQPAPARCRRPYNTAGLVTSQDHTVNCHARSGGVVQTNKTKRAARTVGPGSPLAAFVPSGRDGSGIYARTRRAVGLAPSDRGLAGQEKKPRARDGSTGGLQRACQ